MRIIDPYFEILQFPEDDFILSLLEKAARTCYKSEDKITHDSAKDLLARLIRMGHHSVLEHVSISVRIVCDRGISHELVRHRLASFSQESTRYANYGKDKFGNEITVVRPFFFESGSQVYHEWNTAMLACESAYLRMLEMGAKPQEARSVLPNSLKTDVVVTANLREWRHIFELRCAGAAHPQMRQIMLPMLMAFSARVPVVFSDLNDRFGDAVEAFSSPAREMAADVLLG